MLECCHCSKSFSTNSNRLRHQRKCEYKGVYEDSPPMKRFSPARDEDENESSGDDEEMEDEEEHDDSDIEKDEDSTDDEKSDENDEDIDEDGVWDFVVRQSLENLNFASDLTAEELLSSKQVIKKMAKEMACKIYNWKKAIIFLSQESTDYGKIMKTRDKLVAEEDYSDEEAMVKAFKDRRPIVKKILHERLNILQDIIGESDDDNENIASASTALPTAPP